MRMPLNENMPQIKQNHRRRTLFTFETERGRPRALYRLLSGSRNILRLQPVSFNQPAAPFKKISCLNLSNIMNLLATLNRMKTTLHKINNIIIALAVTAHEASFAE